jgi:hypothetical protein
MRTLLIAIVAAVLGCTKSAPEPPKKHIDIAVATPTHTRSTRAQSLLPPVIETRSAEDLARAACPKTRCKGSRIKPLLASSASTGPVVPPSLTVSQWYIDFANSLGCASDQNSGTSATCTGGCSGSTCPSGIGPLLTVGEWLIHRLGSRAPTFASPTHLVTLNILSSQPLSSASGDPWGAFAPSSPDGMFAMVGALQPVGTSFTAGTVTQISRGNPGNDHEVNVSAGTGLAIGQVLYDITAQSYTWIDALTGSGASLTAVCTNPMTVASLTTITNDPIFENQTSTDGSSWSSGDTLQAYTAPSIYMDRFGGATGTMSAHGTSQTSGAMWIQGVTFADPSGAPSTSTVYISSSGLLTMTLVRADSALRIYNESTNGAGYDLTRIAEGWFDGGTFLTSDGLSIFSGALATSINLGGDALSNSAGGFVDLLNDVIVHYGLRVTGMVDTWNAHFPSESILEIKPGAAGELRAGIVNGSVWGAGTIEVDQGGVYTNRSGSTYTTNMVVGAMTLTTNGLTTGCAPIDGGLGSPPCGIAVTAANVDAYRAIIDGPSGARFTY